KRVMDAIEREDAWRSRRKGRLLRWLPASVAAAAALLLGAFLAGRESAALAPHGEIAKADDLSSMNERARGAPDRAPISQALERDVDGERAKAKDREAQAALEVHVARVDAPSELAEESVRRLKSSLD